MFVDFVPIILNQKGLSNPRVQFATLFVLPNAIIMDYNKYGFFGIHRLNSAVHMDTYAVDSGFIIDFFQKSFRSLKRTQNEAYLTMAVFQYFIGNTDWSVEYQQNIKLLAIDSTSIPTTVPYDFDHAGTVKTQDDLYPTKKILGVWYTRHESIHSYF